MLEYNKLTVSDQHVLTNNAIFVTNQNVTQNTEKNTKKNTEKNAEKNDVSYFRTLIDSFDVFNTTNESSESNSQQNFLSQNTIFLAQSAKSKSDVKITTES